MSLIVTAVEPTRTLGNRARKRSICLALASLLGTSAVSAADRYEVIDLGIFEEDGINQTDTYGINNNDVVAGYAIKQSTVETETNGEVVTTAVQYAHAFTYESAENGLNDLGAIDNSDVSVEITNTNGDGDEVTETVDFSQPFTSSFGFAINDDGTVVGTSSRTYASVLSTVTDDVTTETAAATVVERAVVFESGNAGVVEIPHFDEESPLNMRALGISNSLVVGFASYNDPDDVDENGDPISTPSDHGFAYEIASQTLTLIEPLSDNQSLSLRDINNNGYAVGVSTQLLDEQGSWEVVGWNHGSTDPVERIDIFGGVQQQAWAINDQDVIVGQARREDNSVSVAFSYDLFNQTATDLGVLNENFAASVAYDINNVGQIVGSSQFQNSPVVYHAFLYEDGTLKDLDKMIGCFTGWRLDEARAINEDGVIVGKGILNGEIHGFMLKPVSGSAPDCDSDSDDDGGGSLPVWSIILLSVVRLMRRKN
ncbi:MAG: DUF3466 family protein [Kangiellaceae bacterium]|nr:DUF3466 family protein [Kangiellaceae bacterium]